MNKFHFIEQLSSVLLVVLGQQKALAEASAFSTKSADSGINPPTVDEICYSSCNARFH